MKTTILTILMTAISFVGFAQQEVVQDFESSPTIAGFEGLTSATIISDPTTAGNGLVFELVTSPTGNPWQGAEVILADDSSLDLTTDLIVSVDVWSDVAFSPMLKVETTGTATAAPFAANTQSHTGSGWETLTFTLNTGDDGTATANGVYNKVVFFPNRSSDGTAWNDPIIDGTFYFDNITGVKGTINAAPTGNPPSTAAPTPPARDAADVISLFSNAYTDITVDTWSATWDDSSIEDVVIEGNDTKRINFNNFIGVDFTSNPFDASEMTHFHMDYWTEETDLVGKVLNPKWSNHLGGAGETNAFELTYPVPENATGQWVSIDVPISDFSVVTNADMTAFAQFLLTSNLGVVYVDNIYLYKGEPTNGGGGNDSTVPTTAAPTPPARDAADVISIFSDAYTDITVDTFSADFDDSTVEDTTIAGNAAKKIDFTNFVGIDFQNDRQDASEMTHFHMDFWTYSTDLVGKVFNSKFSQWGGTAGEVSAFELPINTGTDPAIESGTWVSIDVPISDFTNAPQTRDDIAQFLISSNLDVVYVDNIYLYKEGTGGGSAEPTTAAPTPPDRTGELISVFSDKFTDIADTDFNPNWSQSTVVTTEQIEGNATLKYANLNYQGTQFASPLDLSNVDNIHIDVWTGDATSINLFLISTGPVETAYSLPVTQNQWVTYDIPLTEWSEVVNLSDVIQIKIDDGGAGDSPTLYIDNIYFYSGVATSIDGTEEVPNNFTLEQNYPNPFNPSTNISYTLPANAEVTLEVFNVAGQRVATLVDAFQSTGTYNVTFDASNLASGLYTYRLTTGNSVQVKKMMLIK